MRHVDFKERIESGLKGDKSGWRRFLTRPFLLTAVIILAVIVVAQIAIIIALISIQANLKASQNIPAGQVQNNTGEPSGPVPAGPDSNNLQFSFTDLFSGSGWKNESKSDVYQDFFTSSISAPPVYDWRKTPVAIPNDGSQIIAAKSSGKRAVLLTAAGNIYSFDSKERLYARLGLISVPSGANRGFLDFDPGTGKWIAAVVGSDTVRFAVLEEKGGEFKKLADFTRGVAESGAVADPGLSCRGGTCLWLYGSEFLTFPENSGASIKKIEILSGWFDDKDVSSVSMSKIPEGWLISKVRPGEESKYAADIYLWNGQLSLAAKEVFSSDYPGRVRFGYDSAGKKLFGIYAGYIGQAFEFSVSDNFTLVKVRDLSRSFNARVLGGIAAGSVEVYPEIFGEDGSWWMGASPDSRTPRSIKISPTGGAISLTQDLIAGSGQMFLLPGFEAHVVYAVLVKGGVSGIYRFYDRGYGQKEKYTWESSRINSGVLPVKFARINSISGYGNIKYYLSNDGGASWQGAKAGDFVRFPSDGNDFRWKAELFSASDPYFSPWLNLVSVDYFQ